jgi:hypothetical protein
LIPRCWDSWEAVGVILMKSLVIHDCPSCKGGAKLCHPHAGASNNPPIDLGFALFMGDSLLCPKPIWQYLGFYFAWVLSFKEHVWFYSTKALTTVKALGMLGNSS